MRRVGGDGQDKGNCDKEKSRLMVEQYLHLSRGDGHRIPFMQLQIHTIVAYYDQLKGLLFKKCFIVSRDQKRIIGDVSSQITPHTYVFDPCREVSLKWTQTFPLIVLLSDVSYRHQLRSQ